MLDQLGKESWHVLWGGWKGEKIPLWILVYTFPLAGRASSRLPRGGVDSFPPGLIPLAKKRVWVSNLPSIKRNISGDSQDMAGGFCEWPQRHMSSKHAAGCGWVQHHPPLGEETMTCEACKNQLLEAPGLAVTFSFKTGRQILASNMFAD